MDALDNLLEELQGVEQDQNASMEEIAAQIHRLQHVIEQPARHNAEEVEAHD